MKRTYCDKRSPSWKTVLVMVIIGHLGLAWLPVQFSELKGAEPPAVRISLVPAPVVPEKALVETEQPVEPMVEAPVAAPAEQVVAQKKERKPKKRPAAAVEPPKNTQPQPVAAPVPQPVEELSSDSQEVAHLEDIMDSPEQVVEGAPQKALERPSKLAEAAPQKPLQEVDLQSYGAGIFRAVNAEQHYPRMAQRMRMEGTATVRIRIKSDGTLADKPLIVRSSQHDILDNEVLRMVEVSAPFEPLPSGYHQSEAEFVIPVRFSLSRT